MQACLAFFFLVKRMALAIAALPSWALDFGWVVATLGTDNLARHIREHATAALGCWLLFEFEFVSHWISSLPSR